MPDSDAAYERALNTKAYIARMLRGVQQQMEAMQVHEPTMDELSRQLGKE